MKFGHIYEMVNGVQLGTLKPLNRFRTVAIGYVRRGRIEMYFAVKAPDLIPCVAWDTENRKSEIEK